MARGEGNVVVRIYGEIRDLVGKLREGGNEVGRFATSSRNVITKSFSDATSIITSRFGRMGAEAQKAFDRIGATAATSGNAMALGIGAGAAVAAAGIADLAAKGVRSFVNLGESIRRVQIISGATAEDASRMVAVFKLFKVDATAGARAVYMLSKNIENHADTLAADNIQIARNRSGQVDTLQTLLNVGDAYKAVGGGQRGAALASDALGRSGLALIPVLAAGREQITEFWKEAEKHGEIFGQGDVDKAHAFHLQLIELEQSVGGLERALGQGLVPALTDIATTATTVIDDFDKLTRSVGGLGGIISKTWSTVTFKPLRDWVFGVKEGGQSLDDLTAAGLDANGMLADQADGFDAVASAADAADTALKAFDNTITGINSSIVGIPDAMADVDQAFADLEGSSTTATTKAADAQSRLADAIESANRRIRDAQQDVADSTEDLNKQASGDRTGARRRVRDAEERLADVRADSAKSIADAKKNADEVTPTIAATRKEAEGVTTAVEKTVEKMIEQHKPAAEILDYITKQRDRLGEIGTKIGLDKTVLGQYLDILAAVLQTTKDLANLPSLLGGGSTAQTDSFGNPINRPIPGGIAAGLAAGLSSVNITQIFNGPTDPAEQQRQASKQFNGALRRRG